MWKSKLARHFVNGLSQISCFPTTKNIILLDFLRKMTSMSQSPLKGKDTWDFRKWEILTFINYTNVLWIVVASKTEKMAILTIFYNVYKFVICTSIHVQASENWELDRICAAAESSIKKMVFYHWPRAAIWWGFLVRCPVAKPILCAQKNSVVGKMFFTAEHRVCSLPLHECAVCPLYEHCIHTVCPLYEHCIHTIYTPHEHDIHDTVWALYAHRMRPYTHCMSAIIHTVCTLYEHCMHTVCTLSVLADR